MNKEKISLGSQNKWIMVLLGIAVIAGLAYYQLGRQTKREPHILATYSQVPSFSLTNEQNGPVTEQSFHGKIWIANFIFTTCPGPCKAMSNRMLELQKATERAGRQISLVSFSVDPETDTPLVLKRYNQQFHADPKRWQFLTGDKNQIFEIARKGFLLTATENPPEEVLTAGKIAHSTKFALVDGQGQVRGYYDGTDSEFLAKILSDIGDLMQETGL